MKIQIMFLLLATIVICLATHGLCIGTITNSRCKCVKVISKFIHPRKYQRVRTFPRGSYCRKVEIVITLKDGKNVCVNPETQWVKRVVSFFKKRTEETHGVITKESTSE